MNTNKNIVVRYIDEICEDSTTRLDVTYWKDFGIDFNKYSQFETMPLGSLGEFCYEFIEQQPIIKEEYHTFKIKYTGNVVLKDLKPISDIKTNQLKLIKTGDLVFSRINCCRGSIGIVEDYQNNSICTNETHVFRVTSPKVDARYLHIILRHPYYQDLILSQCTGASLERKRISDTALGAFEIPIPLHQKQLELINKVNQHNDLIKKNTNEIERLKIERNKYVLTELGIDLVFVEGDENLYGLSPSNINDNSDFRLDFEYNKPSFDNMIGKIYESTYPIVKIQNLISEPIKGGNSPKGGIYPTKGIVFLRAGEIIENGIDLSNHEYITQEFHDSLKRSKIKGNEVLITIAGTIGRAGVNDKVIDGNINQAVAILKTNDDVLPLYLSAFVNSDAGQVQFAKNRHDFGTPNINTTELAEIIVPLPSLPIQENIVAEVTKYENKINKAKESSVHSNKFKSEIITEFLIGSKNYKNALERMK